MWLATIRYLLSGFLTALSPSGKAPLSPSERRIMVYVLSVCLAVAALGAGFLEHVNGPCGVTSSSPPMMRHAGSR